MQKFVKCHSLQNDFVLLDWLEKSPRQVEQITNHKSWVTTVKSMCHRYLGIGADGVLILFKNQNQQLTAKIYNSDGSDGTRCLNGLRCLAHYLNIYYNSLSQKQIFMGGHLTKFAAKGKEIVTHVGGFDCQEEVKLNIGGKHFIGNKIDVGNPHLVIFAKHNPLWLTQHAKAIASAAKFPNGANIEMVIFDRAKKTYEILVYERGVGLTMACGTGGVAVLAALFKQGKIKAGENILLKMPGGLLKTKVSAKGEVTQQAAAQIVFAGVWNN